MITKVGQMLPRRLTACKLDTRSTLTTAEPLSFSNSVQVQRLQSVSR